MFVVMLDVKNIHTTFTVDEIDHFMSYLPSLYANGWHAHRLSTHVWRPEISLMEVCWVIKFRFLTKCAMNFSVFVHMHGNRSSQRVTHEEPCGQPTSPQRTAAISSPSAVLASSSILSTIGPSQVMQVTRNTSVSSSMSSTLGPTHISSENCRHQFPICLAVVCINSLHHSTQPSQATHTRHLSFFFHVIHHWYSQHQYSPHHLNELPPSVPHLPWTTAREMGTWGWQFSEVTWAVPRVDDVREGEVFHVSCVTWLSRMVERIDADDCAGYGNLRAAVLWGDVGCPEGGWHGWRQRSVACEFRRLAKSNG